LTGNEFEYMSQAVVYGQLSGDGKFTRAATQYLNEYYSGSSSLITHSCTAALEMCALLLDIKPGDEVICPSYTFVSTANAFVLRGAHIIFVDIESPTLCLDIDEVQRAISKRTKAIVAVHYAGVSCDMDRLLSLCVEHNIHLVEDAAQAFGSYYKSHRLGQLGQLGTLSFHETKNIVAGEGGSIIINESSLTHSAEIIREKGTDRSLFMKGEVDKYTWRQMGSSFLPGDLVAAFLLAQLNCADTITNMRLQRWTRYLNNLSVGQSQDAFRLAQIPSYSSHNAHMFYVLCHDNDTRNSLIHHLREHGIHAVFHYIPLHSSPAGLSYGSTCGSMEVTNRVSATIVRLPIYPDLTLDQVDLVCDIVLKYFGL